MKLTKEMHLLLVDDEEDIRDVLEIALADLGYRVHIAENGEEALGTFRQERPQIILTDIKMPGMDGIELLKRVKQESPDTEVIMITGHGDTDLAIKSLKYEAIDFITKPINDEVLEVALKRAHDKIDTREKLSEYTRSLETLVQEKAEMQDHLAALGLMIGSISHGMRGLLTRLDAGLYEIQAALSQKNLDRITEGCRIVSETSERVKKMVLDILFYVKERELKKENINLSEFAGKVADAVEPKACGKGIAFIRKLDTGEATVELDAESVHSALINILENAVDACREDSAKERHEIRFLAAAENGAVRFSIRDNGIGMNEETCRNIFNLFFSAKGKKGTGLGLFIANKIIRQHGGKITVSSTPGLETEFVVLLPIQKSPKVKAP